MTALILMALSESHGSSLYDFFVNNSLSAAKGRNIVNIILVDFRGLDTMGEVTVLTVAGIPHLEQEVSSQRAPPLVSCRAELGEKPGAVGAQAVTITATVVAVDKQKPSITLKKPDGEVVTLPVRKASRLDPVKVGDLLNVTYQRAVAISVEKPQKR